MSIMNAIKGGGVAGALGQQAGAFFQRYLNRVLENTTKALGDLVVAIKRIQMEKKQQNEAQKAQKRQAAERQASQKSIETAAKAQQIAEAAQKSAEQAQKRAERAEEAQRRAEATAARHAQPNSGLNSQQGPSAGSASSAPQARHSAVGVKSKGNKKAPRGALRTYTPKFKPVNPKRPPHGRRPPSPGAGGPTAPI